MQRAEKVTHDCESQYLALNGLLVKVSANVKKPDLFSLAFPALAKEYCSLFVGSKRTHEALSKSLGSYRHS